MKIIVNAAGYVGQSGGAGGAGVFLQYLIGALAQHHSVDVLIAQNSKGFHAPRHGARLIELPYVTGETLRHLRDGPTAVLDPFGALPCAPYPDDMALCVVVHDLMHLERPHFFTASEREGRSRSFAGGLQRADAVVAFSADQARAIRRFYPGAVPAVIPHLPYSALQDRPSSSPKPDVSTYEPFMLLPAVKWPHKNHRTVIEAFGAYIKRTRSNMRLVLCGGPCAESRFSYYPAFELISDQVVDLGLVNDALLGSLLHKASAVLFPTLYEGFGIPVLEAAYLGKIVIASKLDVFDEILGPGGYRAIYEPLCQMRWMDAFAEAEHQKRLDYESISKKVQANVDARRFLNQFTDLLKSAADRYTHPALYPIRGFRSGDRPTSSLVAPLAFADIHGTAIIERGTRHPALGNSPTTRSSTVFRSTEAALERRVCLRAEYDERPAAKGNAPLEFSAWVRLAEAKVDAIYWSANDGNVSDLLPELCDGEWHLVRRTVSPAGFIDIRASRSGTSESVGFDIEIHDPCLLQVPAMNVPSGDPLPRGLTIYVDASSDKVEFSAVAAEVSAINDALSFASGKLHWVVIATLDVIGDENGADLPANFRVQVVDGNWLDRTTAASLASPYDPIDQLLLLDASDLSELRIDHLELLGAALGVARTAASRRLALARTSPSLWRDDERGHIMDVSSRSGQPIPPLDREAIQSCLSVAATKSRPRFAVIETDLIGGISHHSVVTGLFLDGATACGFDAVLGMNKAASETDDETVDSWRGFGTQVYSPGNADDFVEELSAFTLAKKLGPDDVVFMHSLSPQILLGAARFIAASGGSSPRLAMRFFGTSEAMAGHKLSYSKILKSILAVPAIREKMHFFCESRNLIEYYNDAVGIRFPLLLNPEHPSLTLVRNSSWFDPALGGGEQPTLAYFGEARAEKGFDFVPGIVGALIANPAMDAFRFMIQVGSNSLNQTPEMAAAKAALFTLKQQHPTRIRTFESAENPEEFYFLMKHASGVISPYRPDAYGKRGTGVTLEALQMGLDVFAWEETDLYATFKHTGHLVGVGKGEEFADVIARYYAGMAAEAPRAGVAELRQSAAEVCQRMLSLCRPQTANATHAGRPILWVGNDTFGEGCSAVYASQKRALRDIGRPCFELFVPWPDRNWRGVDANAYDAKIYGFDAQYEGNGLAWVARPNFTPELDRILDAVEATGPTYARLRDLNKYSVMPKSLARALAAHTVDQTLLNYAHLYPVIEGKMPLEHVICETHDVVSYQHAVRRGTGVSLTEKIDEFSDLARFPAIVAISASEQHEMANACPASEVFWRLPPYIPEPAAPARAYSGAGGYDLESDEAMQVLARLSPVMLGVYQARPDLRTKFDLGNMAGKLEFFRWWVFFGQFEYADRFGFTRRQYEWLVGDGQDVRHISGLHALMLAARGDLRNAFGTPSGVDAARLYAWAERHSEEEFGVSHATLARKAEVHFSSAAASEEALGSSAIEAVLAAHPLGAPGKAAEHQAMFERVAELGGIDLVLVGSGHPANIVSFEWFLSKVYLPLLAPQGHNLFVAGNVGAALRRHHQHRKLVFLGRCERVEPLLRAARACPLPVVAGSGSPIKTIPALAVNGAVTVTEHVERAFALSEYGIPAFSEPRAFADDLRLLLTDEARRAERVRAARRYVEERLTVEGYVEFWRQRLHAAA